MRKSSVSLGHLFVFFLLYIVVFLGFDHTSCFCKCGYQLVCMDAEAGGSVPGCEGTAGGDQSFCVADFDGVRDNTNGASVTSVTVTGGGSGVAGAQQEAGSGATIMMEGRSVVFTAGIASAAVAVVMGLF